MIVMKCGIKINKSRRCVNIKLHSFGYLNGVKM